MIRLRQLLIECGWLQQDLIAAMTHVHSITQLLSRGLWPQTAAHKAKMKAEVEAIVAADDCLMGWLHRHRKPISYIWEPGADLRYQRPHRSQKLELADPTVINRRTEEDVLMLTAATKQHFKLFRDPFFNEVQSSRDVFLSAEHRTIYELIIDAAENQGFVAVVGGVGSGKSTMRKFAVERMLERRIHVIYPRILDKTRITPGNLMEAMVMDLMPGNRVQNSLEARTRQVIAALERRAQAGDRTVLMMEEAHLLDRKALKCLKQIIEFESGYTRTIGIILIGQPELAARFDPSVSHDIRELVRRVVLLEIAGLPEIQPYLEKKFTVNRTRTLTDVFTPEAITAMKARLQQRRGRRVLNTAYPLSINNLAVQAMNLAAETGEALVTAEIIESL